MTLKVLVIGAAHAIPVIASAAIFGGWGGTFLAAAVMTLIAFATGGSQWVIFDLLGIGFGLFVASGIIGNRKQNPETLTATSQPVQLAVKETPKKKDGDGWLSIVIGLGVLGSILFNAVDRSSPSPKSSLNESIQSTSQPKPLSNVSVAHAAKGAAIEPVTKNSAQRVQVKRIVSKKGDVRECLSLGSNEAIARCSEAQR